MRFVCSKEPSQPDGSFEYPQHMFWLRNKKNYFLLRTLIWGPGRICRDCADVQPGLPEPSKVGRGIIPYNYHLIDWYFWKFSREFYLRLGPDLPTSVNDSDFA